MAGLSVQDDKPKTITQQELAKILQASLPDIGKLMSDIVKTQINVADIGRLYTDQHRQMIESLKVTVPALPVLTIPKIEIPQLKLDYSSLFPDFGEIQKSLLPSLAPSIELIQGLQWDQFAEAIKVAHATIRASLPPNWQTDEIHIPANLEAMLLDEGLALAWVPPAPVVVKLFTSTTAAERRKIVGSHWRGITSAGISELKNLKRPELAEYVEFALDAAASLSSGKSRSAQALSANLLDTILRQNFDGQDRRTITGQQTRMNIDDYPLRVAIVLGGIWGSFGEFWASNGDPIPRRFSRHGSAHAVSKRQYSRINSVLAFMHVVSLLCLLENDLSN